jgi:hypothetical protein
MVDVIVQLVLGILGGTLGGAIVAAALVGRLYRRCTTLEWAVADLQDRASTFKGREMAEKRWKKAENMDAELAQALRAPQTGSRRYDNDPLGS